MALTPAPFLDDIAGGPPGAAHWVQTADQLRIRVGHWRAGGSERSTVLLFPGRTEYIEKYGDTAGELARRGFAVLAIDWRGQGLADRLTDDRRIGHVQRFGDYQLDVAAALKAAAALGLPRPYHLIGHSMGGGIGLRAVLDGIDVRTCAFTGPMWGIRMTRLQRPMSWALSHAAPMLGMGLRLPPTTTIDSYVLSQPFEGNTLTTDPDMYQRMRDQLNAYPELALGGPSLIWLREALVEMRAMSRRPAPDLPCLTFLGSREQIVDDASIHSRMRIWPRGRLELIEGAEHEVLMETPAIRNSVFDRLEAHFSSDHGAGDAATRSA